MTDRDATRPRKLHYPPAKPGHQTLCDTRGTRPPLMAHSIGEVTCDRCRHFLNERIPRKLSVDDLGNAELAEWVQVVRVFLDGVEQDAVLKYDMDKGEVLRCVRNRFGGLVIDGQLIKTELVKGKVEVSLREPV